jgi:CRP-like cAMP-binding protein
VHSLVAGLRAVPSLADCDERTLLQIVGDSANLFWPAGSVVYETGAPSEGLYIVVSGGVRVLEAGRELAVLGAGDFFGELSLLLGSDHQRDVQATEDSELMVVPRERFEALLADNPELAERIRQRAEERAAANTSAAADA